MEARVKNRLWIAVVSGLALAALAAGCGSGGSPESAELETKAEVPAAAEAAKGEAVAGGGESEAGSGGAALPSEAESAATGDIPDNQAFLLYTDKPAGYAIRYPEGWARTGSGADVTFREKGNVIHIAVVAGPTPTPAGAEAGVAELAKADPTVKAKASSELELGGRPAVKIEYTRQSTPDPVTGKRLPLIVDRYEIGKGGQVAVIDLATPEGVDNVDAYRLISESFRWR
jgi:hypothetical protein